ncbi:MAG: hypothetical protein LBF22_01565 [Deltaproteobacteria bacterium]|nr:hypothetical protein [Deltaproteobacteria bacterium]
MGGIHIGGRDSYQKGFILEEGFILEGEFILEDIHIFLKNYNYYTLIQIEEVWRKLKNEKSVLLKVKSLKD